MSTSQAPVDEPIGYKFVGTYFTWLVDEFDHDEPRDDECQPIYALIEDEE